MKKRIPRTLRNLNKSIASIIKNANNTAVSCLNLLQIGFNIMYLSNIKPLSITTNVTKQIITVAHKINTILLELLGVQKYLSVNLFNINKAEAFFNIKPVDCGNNAFKDRPILVFVAA